MNKTIRIIGAAAIISGIIAFIAFHSLPANANETRSYSVGEASVSTYQWCLPNEDGTERGGIVHTIIVPRAGRWLIYFTPINDTYSARVLQGQNVIYDITRKRLIWTATEEKKTIRMIFETRESCSPVQVSVIGVTELSYYGYLPFVSKE